MSAAEKLTVVSPGIYKRDELNYGAIDAINQSSLKHIAKSPLHYKHALENKIKQTASMFRGTAAHTAILEPVRFMKDYAVFDGERRAGKKWDAFEAENSHKTIIKESEFNTAMAMRDAVHSDPVARQYVTALEVEAVMVWRDAETGLLCKGRTDGIKRTPVIVDVKSAKDVSAHWFAKQAANLNYHLQASFYSDGYEVITGDEPEYVIVAVESAAPHDVVVYRLDEDVIANGRNAYRDMLKKVAECRAANKWPGYSGGLEVNLVLPKWAVPDEDDDFAALGLE